MGVDDILNCDSREDQEIMSISALGISLSEAIKENIINEEDIFPVNNLDTNTRSTTK